MPTWWHPRAAELLKPEIALSTLAAAGIHYVYAELIEATKSKACVSRLSSRKPRRDQTAHLPRILKSV